ncbi:MAG: SpoIIE family protein phosphatase [Spirochaetaceae bacterium]|jgi:sigma-B regulation protein RsbU (phosphoserine phosphatase)|nr:SpoIIE family protein phosphatase [Spirochaetaceae bacterium]
MPTRYNIRYYVDADVELDEFPDYEFVLKNISYYGCCLESPMNLTFDKNKIHHIKINPEPASKIEPFELTIRSRWKHIEGDFCEYGFKTEHGRKNKNYLNFLEYNKSGRYGKIKKKILHVILSAALGAVLLLSVANIVSILNMRSSIKTHGNVLGSDVAEESVRAMEEQAKHHLMALVEDKANLTNEKLVDIQNKTIMTANIATNIFTNKNNYKPRYIDYLQDDQIGTSIPHIRTAPGVLVKNVQNELYLAANITDVLSQSVLVENGNSSTYIGSELGYFIVVDQSAPAPAIRTNYDARKRGWYVGAKEQDGLYWTPVFEDASGRGPAISCAMPFYDLSGGKRVLKGVAGNGTVLSANIKKIIDSTRIGISGYAFVLNKQGQMISNFEKKEYITDVNGNIVGEDYLHSSNAELNLLAEEMISGKSGLSTITMNGKAVYAAYSPLTVTGWSLAIVVPIEELIAPAHVIKQNVLSLTRKEIQEINKSIIILGFALVLVIIITVLAVFIFAGRLSDNLTAPITALNEGARIIGNGDLNYKLSVKSGDEVEMLAESFNQMVRNIKRITTEKERIGTELSVAAQIQTNMLPDVEPDFADQAHFDLWAISNPAKEVGGDFYDFFMISKNKLAVIIADVSGKGVPAALFMVVAKTLLKDHVMLGSNLSEVCFNVNNQLCKNNKSSMFVTAFIGVLETDTGKFRYINAGHNPPLIRQKKGEFGGNKFAWLAKKSGLVLAALEDSQYQIFETTLEKDDILFLYTDGVNEATNISKEQFGYKRLVDTINSCTNAPLKKYTNTLLASLDTFQKDTEQADDITMLIMQYRG